MPGDDELENQQSANEEAERQQQFYADQQRYDEEERLRAQQEAEMNAANNQDPNTAARGGQGFNLDTASKRYSTIRKIYSERGFFERTFSHFLPNSWTSAGRIREKLEYSHRMLERGINGNDLGTGKKYAGIADPKTRVLCEYRDNYNKLASEYMKINWFARRASFFVSNRLAKGNNLISKIYRALIPNSVLRACDLRTDIKMNDYFLKEKLPTMSRFDIRAFKRVEMDRIKHPQENIVELQDFSKVSEVNNEKVEEKEDLSLNNSVKENELDINSKSEEKSKNNVAIEPQDFSKDSNKEININTNSKSKVDDNEIDVEALMDDSNSINVKNIDNENNPFRAQPEPLMNRLMQDSQDTFSSKNFINQNDGNEINNTLYKDSGLINS